MSFQLTDLTRGLNQTRFLYNYATGLGKSYELAGLLTHLRKYGEIHKAIILTSSIGILNLASELKKFIADYDETKTLVIDSITSLKDRLVFDYKDIDIIICGYDTFRSIGDAYDKSINNRNKKVKYRKSSLPLKEWFGNKQGIIFLDECHLLGSPNSLRSKFIDMNLQFFKYRYLFSATPSDKEIKLYMILKVLDKKLINGLSYLDWLATYCELGTRFSAYAPNLDTWNQAKWALLQDELYRNYAVKREKSLLNLPEAYEVPLITLDMSSKHRDIYEAFSYEFVDNLQKQNNKNGMGLIENLVNTFPYLQLSVDNPKCLLKSKNFDNFTPALQSAIKKFDYEKEFKKLHALDLIIEDECDEKENKVIIFYYHPQTMEDMSEHFRKTKRDHFILSADIEKDERFPIIEKFKKSKAKILIASVLIANSSFTLTECKAAIFYERPWDGITYEQAKGRIYRIGQTEEVRYYTLCYNNSIDSLQLKTLDSKDKVMSNLIKKMTLSPEEWRLVFNYNEKDYSKLFKE